MAVPTLMFVALLALHRVQPVRRRPV